jgi:hypothetical protein
MVQQEEEDTGDKTYPQATPLTTHRIHFSMADRSARERIIYLRKHRRKEGTDGILEEGC